MHFVTYCSYPPPFHFTFLLKTTIVPLPAVSQTVHSLRARISSHHPSKTHATRSCPLPCPLWET
jgi:hypothetical protein